MIANSLYWNFVPVALLTLGLLGWAAKKKHVTLKTVGIVAVALISLFFYALYNPHIRFTRGSSETIRNYGFVLAALIGLPLAIWRSSIANSQAKSAQDQTVNSQEQTKILANNHLAETYTKAIDQIGNNKEAIQLGGLYALEKIAQKNHDYHGQIMEVLCSFVRLHAPRRTEEQIEKEIERELPKIIVQTALTIIGRRNVKHDTSPDGKNKVVIDLSGANLMGAHLGGADLIGAVLIGTNLIGANLNQTDLRRANLTGADLSEADLREANLEGSIITQEQFDSATTDKDTKVPEGIINRHATPDPSTNLE